MSQEPSKDLTPFPVYRLVRSGRDKIDDADGSVTDFDGLLGMDIIGGFSYTIDFAKKVIVWK